MTAQTAQYDDGETPLAGYAALAAAFTAGAAGFVAGVRRRGVPLPARVPPWDVALLGAATYKTSRLLSNDKITSFVRAPFTRRSAEGQGPEVLDEPRGTGLRRAVGDLVSCPFCTSVWAAGALVCGYTAVPRATRLVCAGLGAVTLADWLQYAWTWTQQTAED
ncbi:DUF1360 domain-containing protein [Streptomyces cylindrosporus]|uniref:DUF1360 domain-containing protein n=1 Tax=Streptomyces cylindrosporus TaxID=2927583 RepID=A0ABS9YMT0_9ACTN|nr:DUF1360 domain-containing protein [Streptomyces cylindrosporus]MCI3278522.1 DUF1360 domain-containing protein [Streptomyces cylindrosporus]